MTKAGVRGWCELQSKKMQKLLEKMKRGYKYYFPAMRRNTCSYASEGRVIPIRYALMLSLERTGKVGKGISSNYSDIKRASDECQAMIDHYWYLTVLGMEGGPIELKAGRVHHRFKAKLLEELII